MNETQAAEIAAKGNAILEAAAQVDENLPVAAVFDLIRPRIGRINRPTGVLELVAEDAYFIRELQKAREQDRNSSASGAAGTAVALFNQSAAEIAVKVQGVERMFYACDPVPPARMLKILSQKRVVREGLAGKQRTEGGGEPLTAVLPQHILDWAAQGAAVDAVAGA
jgi:hypothetical protein